MSCTVKHGITWMNMHMEMICRWGYAQLFRGGNVLCVRTIFRWLDLSREFSVSSFML